MLKELKQLVYEGNMLLPKYGLVTFTWGNVSGFDKESGYVVIKPSGIEYEQMSLNDLVVVDLEGNQIEGNLNPSSDTETHLEIYRSFPEIGGITHTHSLWATIFSQGGREIKPYGTTHGDYFSGAVPCTREMTEGEISNHYELNTGKVIVETFQGKNPYDLPGVLVKSHGPFTWGKEPIKAVENAVVLEEIAQMAYHTEMLMGKTTTPMNPKLLNKHFFRKHGENAYYGQW
ncbi:MAG: L-ribulose-5-phosphate 4-epimerase [Eubacteriaceae bacterium]